MQIADNFYRPVMTNLQTLELVHPEPRTGMPNLPRPYEGSVPDKCVPEERQLTINDYEIS